MERKKDSQGFTMIEMVVVLAVIAILAAILTPMITAYVDRARLNAAQSDLKNIAAAVTQFSTDAKFWPIYKVKPTDPNATSNIYTILNSSGIDATPVGSGWSTALSDTSNRNTLETVMNTDFYSLGTGSRQQWKGAYMEFGADPWGSSYYLTAANLTPNGANVAYVISPGANQSLDTDLNITRSTAGGTLSSSGDDLVVRLR